MDEDVDAVVGEIDGARGEVADFEGAFAAGGEHEGQVNFFFGTFGVIEEFEGLDEHPDDAAEAWFDGCVLCFGDDFEFFGAIGWGGAVVADEGESIAAADGNEGAGGIDAGAVRGFLAAGGAFAVGHGDDLSVAMRAGFNVHGVRRVDGVL